MTAPLDGECRRTLRAFADWVEVHGSYSLGQAIAAYPRQERHVNHLEAAGYLQYEWVHGWRVGRVGYAICPVCSDDVAETLDRTVAQCLSCDWVAETVYVPLVNL